jgi:hypothetical protein
MNRTQLEDANNAKWAPARAAVACKAWRWMPGMLSEKGLRVHRRDDDGYVVGYYANHEYIAECVPGTLPDLADPATLGCLLALVREAHRDATIFAECHPVGDRWQCHSADGGIFGAADTEAAALVAALQAAE